MFKNPINVCLDHFEGKTAMQWAEFCNTFGIKSVSIKSEQDCMFCTSDKIKEFEKNK